MRRSWVALLSMLSCTLLLSGTEAGFLNKYADWQGRDASYKAAYVAGFMDSHTGWGNPSDKDYAALAVAHARCMTTLGLTDQMLAKVIDSAYVQEPSRYRLAPGQILYCEL